MSPEPISTEVKENTKINNKGVATLEKKRQQLTDILGISISPARCAAHLKKNLYNKEIDTNIKLLKSKLTEPNADIPNINKEISTLTQKIIRISSETSTVMAVICDGFVEDLLKHSINETLASNKKMVDVNYIMSGDHKKNLYYSIYHKLPSFVNYDPKVYEEMKKKRTEDNKKHKKSKITVENTEKAETTETTEITETTETTETTVVDTDDGKTTFNTYIDAVLKNVKKQLQLSDNVKIRTSIEVRDFLSDMIIECIKRFVILSKIFIQRITGVRTMNADHIKVIVNMFMKDEGNTDDQIELVLSRINEKIDMFHKHIVAEKENKINLLDDNAKKELSIKLHERIAKKKKTDLEMTEKKLHDMTEKIKKLKEDNI
jgi:hypothetical protein